MTRRAEDRHRRPAEPKLRDFCPPFAERAFRRPLDDEQASSTSTASSPNAKDPETAVKRVVLLALKSPRFLYRELAAGRLGRLRRRLAALVRALGLAARPAAARRRGGRQARHRASRSRPRPSGWSPTCGPGPSSASSCSSGSRSTRSPDLAKDPKRFPGFDAAIASDLRTSLDLFLDDVVWGESSDFRQLLLAD